MINLDIFRNFTEAFIWNQPGLFIIKDMDSKFRAANAIATKLFGYQTIEQMEGLSDSDVRCDAARFAKMFVEEDVSVFKDNTTLSAFAILKYADDNIYLMHFTKSILTDTASKPIGLITRANFYRDKNSLEILQKLKHHKYKFDVNSILGSYYIDDKLFKKIQLADKEKVILFHLLRGKSNKEISSELNTSIKAINLHLEALQNKFGCKNTTGLVDNAITLGYLNAMPAEIMPETMMAASINSLDHSPNNNVSWYHNDIANNHNLTQRQLTCLSYYLQCMPFKRMAQILNISPKTIVSYLEIVRNKLNCTSRYDLIKKARELGIL